MTSRFILPISDVGAGITPSSGALLYFYETGTTTPKNTYSDSAGTIPNANPVVANSLGQFPDIFITGTYKVVLKSSAGVQYWSADPVDEYLISSDLSAFGGSLLTTIVNSTTIQLGESYTITDRGYGVFDVVLASGVTPNTFNIVQCVGVPTLALVLRETQTLNISQLGAVGAADESAIAQTMIDVYNKLIIPKGLQIFVAEVEVKDDTYIENRGKISLVASSVEWTRIFTNSDRVNGNKRVTIDNTYGEIDGNYPAQGTVVQHSLYFVGCSDFEIFGGKFGRNRAADETVHTPSNHPEGPFVQGVPYGESSVLNPTIGCVVFMGGKNNRMHNYRMNDWQQEGVQMRWNEGSSITDFKAINGPETDNLYYENVDFGSRDTAASLSIGSQVLVQDGHSFSGIEQQPDLIYSSLISGVTDLTLEDYTDAARWTIVERDITNDLGYTAARTGGAKGQMNLIANGYAAFCRASSFSQDSEFSCMSNLFSYHNAFFNGINFGHESTPASRGFASGLTSINAGWKTSAGGLDFGIAIVSESSDVTLSDFHVSGARAKGVNISGNADEIKVSNGTIKWSGAEGLLAFNSIVKCSNVTSRLNGSLDFNVTGTGRLSLSNCEDSDRRSFNSDEIYPDFLNQAVRSLISSTGSRKEAFLSSFTKASGQPLVRILFDDGATSADNLTIEIEYLERNTGSGAIGNQYAVKETWLMSGTGGARNVLLLDAPYQQGRQFNVVWATDTIQVFLQNNVPSDVAAVASSNSVRVTISSQVSSGAYQVRLG